jgi:replicative DNA helicase
MIQPYSLEIEQSILFCLITDSEILEENIDLISPDDFFEQSNRLIFNGIKYLHKNKQPVDILTIHDKMKDEKLKLYMIHFIEAQITTANFNHHFKLLKDYSIKRQIIKAANKVIEDVMDEDKGLDAQTIKNNAQQIFEDVQDIQKQQDSELLRDVMIRLSNKLEKRYKTRGDKKLYTGLHDLDRMTAGLHGGEMTVIAARPSVGKTALAIQITENLARKGNNILYVSREMSDEQIAERMLVKATEIDGNLVRLGNLKDEHWVSIANALGPLCELPIRLDSTTTEIQQLRTKVRKLWKRGLCDVLIVDYLQLMMCSDNLQSREQEVARISRIFKLMSLEFDIPVIVLSQLKRTADTRAPKLSDLRESGAIEQDADNVIFIHRPEDGVTNDLVHLMVEKQRNGPIGTIEMLYIPKMMKFFDIDRTSLERGSQNANRYEQQKLK